MASIPRILVVDHSNQIGNIIRGAMTLMDRRFIMVEVPNAHDALDELANSEVNLLVTAYDLPDLNGMDLAARAVRESAGTPVIVLADQKDPEVEAATLANAAYTYLVRPVGEQFLRALRIGLDGEAAVAAQESIPAGGGGLELGPVPELDERTLRDRVLTMMRDTVAMGAFVADRLGRVIFAEGMTGYFDINVCAASLAPYFAHTVDLRPLIGGNAWSLQYFDGDNYDLFAMALGLHYFVVLIFDGTKRAAFGPVTRYGREGTDEIIEQLGAEAWSYRRQVSKVTQTMTAVAVAPEKPDNPAVEQSPIATAAVSAATPPVTVAAPPEFKLEPVKDLDVDKLFSQKVDESSFDDLFAPEELTQEVTFVANENSVSFDEAMNMGILDE